MQKLKYKFCFIKQFILFLFIAFVFVSNAFSQEKGKLVRETVHGTSLEKTATGDAADRSVFVYLPPSYESAATKRYPVVYLLHGIGDTNEVWIRDWTQKNAGYGTIPDLMDRGIAE